ncbi:heterokaryon incompatibility protein-domain-containing protein [Nemania sp. FL0916]|nr:heterokaryon incompatibility protein-domain-containing protein [Nemania sp. FL0916]
MWLIDTSTLQLKFVGEAEKGSYAILSHTWGEDEVSFEQFRSLGQLSLQDALRQKNLVKIVRTCEIAVQRGLSHAWVDTCCIDKSSSAELSEAINSMFKYYQQAAFCIAFISDLSGSSETIADTHFVRCFPGCRWLGRGWTLQELIAPSELVFYDATWTSRGSKSYWKSLLHRETGVDETILDSPSGLKAIPVARRMSWAAHRQTTRTEDMAYCLLGIFDVNIPPIYGEGQKAFTRLQEEIVKDSSDLSLFAWRQLDSSQRHRGILAKSVAEFAHCREIKHRIKDFPMATEFTLTNRGLRIETALVNVPAADYYSILNLGVSYRDDWAADDSRGWIGIYLAKTNNGFVRARPDILFKHSGEGHRRFPPEVINVRKMVDASESFDVERRSERAIVVKVSRPPEWAGAFTLDSAMPGGLWDRNRATFLHQGRGINAYIRCKVSFPDGTVQSVIVGCSTMAEPLCNIWHIRDPVWSIVDKFLSTANETADFLIQDHPVFSGLRWKHGKSPPGKITLFSNANAGDSVSISFTIKETTDRRGQLQFVLHISILEPYQADRIDR